MTSTDFPSRVLKDNTEIFADYICAFFHESKNSCKFLSLSKSTNVTPAFKICYRGSKV